MAEFIQVGCQAPRCRPALWLVGICFWCLGLRLGAGRHRVPARFFRGSVSSPWPYGVAMHANPGPQPPTSRRPPGLAWVGSLLVHATAFAALVWASQPATQAPGLERRLGALMVRLEAITAPRSQEPNRGDHDAASNRDQRPPSPAQPARPAPPSPHATVPDDSARPDPSPPPGPDHETGALKAEPLATQTLPPPASPQARWGGLFTPLISQPLGRGRWGGGMAPSAPPPQQQAALQQAQAMQVQRAALMQRLQSLGALLPQTPLVGRCQVQITLGSADGQVLCDDANDLNRVRAMLNDFLAPTPLPRSDAPDTLRAETICLDLQGPVIRWTPCAPPESQTP